MAKQHSKPAAEVSHSEAATAVAEPVQELVEAPKVKEPKPLRKFRVHLAANTPLIHKTATVEAFTAEEAWDKFCDLNGISGSSCERTTTEVTE